MTNFERLKNDDEIMKCALAYRWGVNKKTGEVGKCTDALCQRCLFYEDNKPCDELREEWLNEKHNNQPLYKEGDIVISKKGKIYLVFKEGEGNLINDLIVADNANAFECGIGTYISKNKIKRKVGNIKEEE